MSELRKQLQTARDKYRQQRYPGDLADELLRPAIKLSQWIAPIGLVAAAALVAIAINWRHVTPAVEPVNPEIAKVISDDTSTTQPTEQIAVAMGGVPDFSASDTSELSFAPSGYTFSVSVPSFSTVASDDSATQPSDTTQQSKETI